MFISTACCHKINFPFNSSITFVPFYYCNAPNGGINFKTTHRESSCLKWSLSDGPLSLVYHTWSSCISLWEENTRKHAWEIHHILESVSHHAAERTVSRLTQLHFRKQEDRLQQRFRFLRTLATEQSRHHQQQTPALKNQHDCPLLALFQWRHSRETRGKPAQPLRHWLALLGNQISLDR